MSAEFIEALGYIPPLSEIRERARNAVKAFNASYAIVGSLMPEKKKYYQPKPKIHQKPAPQAVIPTPKAKTSGAKKSIKQMRIDAIANHYRSLRRSE